MIKKKSFAILTIILVVAVSLGCSVFSQKEESLSTNTVSTSFSTQDEKIRFARKYLNLPSKMSLTEFHIVYQDNSKSWVPGSSDWDIRIAAKVRKESIDKWTDGFEDSTAQEVDLDWWRELPLESPEWKRDSPPRFYKRPNQRSYLVVYEEEGIVLKRVTTTY